MRRVAEVIHCTLLGHESLLLELKARIRTIAYPSSLLVMASTSRSERQPEMTWHLLLINIIFFKKSEVYVFSLLKIG